MAKVKTVKTVNYYGMTEEQLLAECYGLDRLRDEWACTCFDIDGDDYLCFKDVNGNSDDRGYAVYLKSTGELLCLVSDAGNALEAYEDCEYGMRRSELYKQIAMLAGWPENMSELNRQLTWRQLIAGLYEEYNADWLDMPVYVCMDNEGNLEPVYDVKTWFDDKEIQDNCLYLDVLCNTDRE